MKRTRTYTPELREEAVKLVLAQGLTLEDAAVRFAIPKGTLANWVPATSIAWLVVTTLGRVVRCRRVLRLMNA